MGRRWVSEYLDGTRSSILAVTVYERRRGPTLNLRLEVMVAEGEISVIKPRRYSSSITGVSYEVYRFAPLSILSNPSKFNTISEITSIIPRSHHRAVIWPMRFPSVSSI